MNLSVGIMGAGRMAQGFDAPGDAQVLSLAHAVTRTQDLTLGSFFDADPERAGAAEARWSVTPGPREREAWLATGWDVVLIATPDACHGADLADVLARRPRAVLVEKPLSTDPNEAARLLEAAAATGVALLVDFPRRYHRGVAAVAGIIDEERLGRPLAASFVHSGSAEHAAVHMLDLFHGWWGDGWRVERRASGGNASLLAFVRGGERVDASVQRLPGNPYYVWEMSVLCESGRVALVRSPEVLELSRPAPHPLYPGFDVLTPEASWDMEAEPLLCRVMADLVDAASDADVARARLARETSSQRFTGAVLRELATRAETAA
jgi:hypothetical protein